MPATGPLRSAPISIMKRRSGHVPPPARASNARTAANNASNHRSSRTFKFRYFTERAATDIPDGTGKTHEIGCGDATKCEVANLPLGLGQYNGNAPDATIAERDTRAAIKSVRLTLIGMNPSQDIAFT